MGMVDDVFTHIENASPAITGSGTGWYLSKRAVTDDHGDRIVIVTEIPGRAPETPAPAGTLGDSAFVFPSVQVRVRGRPWKADEARAKIQEIYDILHGVLREAVGTTIYSRVKANSSEPIFIGYDEPQHRPGFTWTFSAVR